MSEFAYNDSILSRQSSSVWSSRIDAAQRTLVDALLYLGSGFSGTDIQAAGGFVLGASASLKGLAWPLRYTTYASRPAGYPPLGSTTSLTYVDRVLPLEGEQLFPLKNTEGYQLTSEGVLIIYPEGFRAEDVFWNDLITLDGVPVAMDGEPIILTTDLEESLILYNGDPILFNGNTMAWADGDLYFYPPQGDSVFEGFIFRHAPNTNLTSWSLGSRSLTLFSSPYAGPSTEWIARPTAGSLSFRHAAGGTIADWAGEDFLELYRKRGQYAESLWLIDLPPGVHPTLLISKSKVLAEGSAFYVAHDKMITRKDPSSLWGDHVTCMAYRRKTDVCRSDLLRADGVNTSGASVARYLRQDQSMAAFEEALREVARLPAKGLRVVDIEPVGGQLLLHFSDGVTFLCNGTRLRVGDLSDALLRCRSAAEGPQWFTDISLPLPARSIYPVTSLFAFSRKPVPVSRTSGGLDADLSDADLAYWLREKDPALGALSGLSVGESETVDLQQLVMKRYSQRLIIIDTLMAYIDPLRWKAISDFALNNRPAGSLITTH